MTAYTCVEACAAAARADILRTLIRHFETSGDPDKAKERASALLDHYDHQTANRIRAAAWGDDSPGNHWNWWDAATIPEQCANLIDPKEPK